MLTSRPHFYVQAVQLLNKILELEPEDGKWREMRGQVRWWCAKIVACSGVPTTCPLFSPNRRWSMARISEMPFLISMLRLNSFGRKRLSTAHACWQVGLPGVSSAHVVTSYGCQPGNHIGTVCMQAGGWQMRGWEIGWQHWLTTNERY